MDRVAIACGANDGPRVTHLILKRGDVGALRVVRLRLRDNATIAAYQDDDVKHPLIVARLSDLERRVVIIALGGTP